MRFYHYLLFHLFFRFKKAFLFPFSFIFVFNFLILHQNQIYQTMTFNSFCSLLLLSAPFAMCLSCGESKTEKSEQDSIACQIDPNVTQALAEYSITDTVTVRGALYTYEFSFHNDKSAPVITNAEGLHYYQNDVVLTIYRGRSSEEIFTHNFKKEEFKQYVPDGLYENTTIAGFNFNYMELGKHDAFHFITVVGDPDETSDIAYNIAIDISVDLNISTRIVNNIDTEPITDDMNIDPTEDDA